MKRYSSDKVFAILTKSISINQEAQTNGIRQATGDEIHRMNMSSPIMWDWLNKMQAIRDRMIAN